MPGPTLNKKSNFQDWLYATFGKTLSETFFIPQNQKSWAYPLDKMSFSWIEKRIKITNLQAIGAAPIGKGWGGNAVFYYPKTGGIGFLWQQMAKRFKDKIKYKSEVVKVDYQKKSAYLESGQTIDYQHLISTMSLDLLLKSLNTSEVAPHSAGTPRRWRRKLHYNSGLVIGLGIKGRLTYGYHWLYYPQKQYPFFRLVFPSNFSQTAPECCSILAEISLKEGNVLGSMAKQRLINNSLKRIIQLGLFVGLFEGKVISKFEKLVKYSYPIPTLDRDQTLANINEFLSHHQIFSLGRFGGWRYEEGNMDNSFFANEMVKKGS